MRINKLLIREILVVSCLGLSKNLYSHVVLDYPLGNELFSSGEVIQIQWHVAIPHDQIDWDLYFTYDNGENWIPIAENIPISQNSFDWTVPEINTTEMRVKIVQDNTGTNYEGISPFFTIKTFSSISEVREEIKTDLFLSYLNGNPVFNFTIPSEELVNIEIYDLNGRLIKSLTNTMLSPGKYQIGFDEYSGLNNHLFIYRFMAGKKLKSGLFYRFPN